MSWAMEIFFNAPYPLDDVIRELENLWLIKFKDETHEFGSLYRFEGLGLLIDVLDEHDMEDDMGINFSNYSYQISIEVIIKVKGYKSFGRTIALFLANQIYDRLGWSCIVVEDLQEQVLMLL